MITDNPHDNGWSFLGPDEHFFKTKSEIVFAVQIDFVFQKKSTIFWIFENKLGKNKNFF